MDNQSLPSLERKIMAKVKVDLDMLLIAMEDHVAEIGWYLDKQTGEMLQVSAAFFGDDDEMQEKVEEDPERYMFIEPIDSHDSFEIMEDFIATVSDLNARNVLTKAISRRKPFRNFKEALYEFEEIKENWFNFHHEALLQKVKDLLECEKVEVEFPENDRKDSH